MTALSRPARDLTEALREYVRTRKKWDGTHRTKVPRQELLQIFRAVPRSLRDGELESAALRGYLDELVAHGDIAFMGGTDGERIALPPGVWVLPDHQAVPRPRKAVPVPVLHARTRRAASHWADARPRTRAGIQGISDWFFSEPDMTPVPVRERSLDIYGSRAYSGLFEAEEKALDELSGPFFSDRDALYELLCTYPVPPQLLTERLIPENDGYYGKIGDGDILLVVENVTTCWSLVEALDGLDDHAVGYVVCGMGNSFLASLSGIKMLRRGRIAEIRYFGDLDPTGLRIPTSAAKEAAKDPELPPVRLALGLYRALLRIGTPLPRKEKPLPVTKAAELARGLGPAYEAQVAALLSGSDRLAQEWTGLRYLTTHDDWHGDVS
ncbi:DUF2399 domain-containing protein [Streptomyces sp. NPDC048290]|uniref:DUF2399 domain-containing protein n=1 Tax=Streptomyces sp. NPDC048290 TaxID=3155811 RepID=UPI003424A8C8